MPKINTNNVLSHDEKLAEAKKLIKSLRYRKYDYIIFEYENIRGAKKEEVEDDDGDWKDFGPDTDVWPIDDEKAIEEAIKYMF